jgi:exonuclease III
MLATPNLTIVQYNVNKSKDKVQRSFLQSLDPKTHHIIAIQEPWINPHSGQPATCKDQRYYTVIAKQGTPRTCIYVSKEIANADWQQVTQEGTGGDITSIEVTTSQGQIQIHSLYNPPPVSRSSIQLGTMEKVPGLTETGQHILVGDFNLHHPQWGSDFTPPHHFLSGRLLGMTEQADMDLITPKGMETWAARNSSSTLDLCFATTSLASKVLRCAVNIDLESASDHLPVQTEFEIQAQEQALPEPQLNWKAAKWNLIQEQLKTDLQEMEDWNLGTGAEIDLAIDKLTEILWRTAQTHTPEKKPSLYQQPYWTKECTEKVKEARKARRRWTQSHTQETWDKYQKACQDKKTQIRRDKQQEWRSTVGIVTQHPEQMWKLAKWARRPDQDKEQAPQFPQILDSTGTVQTTQEGKAKAFGAHFFGTQVEADLGDIPGTEYPPPLSSQWSVSPEEIRDLIKKLPGTKAPGPDKIHNKYLKACVKELQTPLAILFTACMRHGHCPQAFKHSLTCVLRKPQKGDYTRLKSYRPIALLNTIGKLLEKVVAIRITDLAEEHNILPETQMGGRAKRSTLTALELITEQVKTLWHYGNNKAASLLSLDISGAFDNVSHTRLLHILRQKGFPGWIVQFVQSFLQGRTTQILLGRYKSGTTPTETGIPQGSAISPILFLLFMADLTPLLNSRNTSASGFVDDTNILAWSDTTEENCRTLQTKHDLCEDWARRHGAKFAPEKYQLIHFSKARTRHNMAATVTIQGHETKPSPELRVLGVWLDPKLSWNPQIKKAQHRANCNSQSIEKLTTSTWGATFSKAKIMYKAIVQPAMLYGSQVWAATDRIPQRMEKPLNRTQALCLKKVLRAYRSTPTRVVEMETGTPPVKHYLAGMRLQYAGKTSGYPVQQVIQKATDKIKSQHQKDRTRTQTDRTPQKETDHKDFETLATLIDQEKEARAQARGGQADRKKKGQDQAELIAKQMWKEAWNKEPIRPGEPKAFRRFGTHNYLLYKNLKRAEASLAIQIRSEHIGFRAYLHQRRVPGYETKACPCGYLSQNPEHMLLRCPQWSEGRGEWRAKARDRSYQALISNPGDLQRITRWILRQGFIKQFSLAEETERWIETRQKEAKAKGEAQRQRARGQQTR